MTLYSLKEYMQYFFKGKPVSTNFLSIFLCFLHNHHFLYPCESKAFRSVLGIWRGKKQKVNSPKASLFLTRSQCSPLKAYQQSTASTVTRDSSSSGDTRAPCSSNPLKQEQTCFTDAMHSWHDALIKWMLVSLFAILNLSIWGPLELKRIYFCSLCCSWVWSSAPGALGLYCDTGSVSYGLPCLAPIRLFRNGGRSKVSTMAGFVLNSGVTPAGQGGVWPS